MEKENINSNEKFFEDENNIIWHDYGHHGDHFDFNPIAESVIKEFPEVEMERQDWWGPQEVWNYVIADKIARYTVIIEILTDYRKRFLTSGSKNYTVFTCKEVIKILTQLLHFAAPRCGLHSLKADKSAKFYALTALEKAAHIKANFFIGNGVYSRKIEDIAVKPLAELSVLKQYLHILIITCSNALSIIENIGIIAEKYDAVNIIENGRRLAVNKRIIFHAVGKYLSGAKPVDISPKPFTDELHTLSPDFFAKLLYLVGKLITFIQDFTCRRYFYRIKRISTALRISVKFGNGVYLISPEFDTDRFIGLYREYIKDRAAY